MMKVAFFSSEVFPFAKTGGLADMVAGLSSALAQQGCTLNLITPFYQETRKASFSFTRFKEDILYLNQSERLRIYFIENDNFFNRKGLYQENGKDYEDNLERFSYFCRRGLDLLKEINFQPEIIHLHDWQTSLVAVYLNTIYQYDLFYQQTKTVLTLHNLGYQGIFPKEKFSFLNLDWNLFSMEGLEFYGKINLLKGGIIFSDIITTVSPTYAKEILKPEYGFGLEGVLKKRKKDLYGILNGLDYNYWAPEKDPYLCANFSSSNPSFKQKNKEELQKILNLPQLANIPLLGMVCRLTSQKGIDLLLEALDRICKLGCQLVILGVGEPQYQNLLKKYAARYPQTLSVRLGFDEPLAHKIYAGSDIFLMPSLYEPSGLGQMIALRYGSIPLVFKTGGLADTVNSKNGFLFEEYSPEALLKTIKKAFLVYENKTKWKNLVRRAMREDFSWEKSAKIYISLYEKAKKQ